MAALLIIKETWMWPVRVNWTYFCHAGHFWELNQYAGIRSMTLIGIQETSKAFRLIPLVMLRRPPVLGPTLSAEYQCEFEELIWWLFGALGLGGSCSMKTPLREARCLEQLLLPFIPLSLLVAGGPGRMDWLQNIYGFNEVETWQLSPRKTLPGSVSVFQMA